MLELGCASNPALGTALTLAGYLVGAGVFTIALLTSRERAKIAPRCWAILGGAGLLCGIAGAKLSQWLMLGWPGLGGLQILNPFSGGRTIIGGIVCGWIAVEITKAVLRVRVSTGAPFALSLPAGEVLGRLGCWFKGCCGGIDTELPWGILCAGRTVHPSQLYASAAALLTLIILLALRSRLRREGDLFQVYLILFGVSRFAIEFTRTQDQLYWGLSAAQWFAAELALAGVFVMQLRRWHTSKPSLSTPPETHI